MAEVTTTDSVTAEDQRKAIAEEYGQWVAAEPIFIDGVLAFAEGHPVPVGHVKKFGFDKSGVVSSTKSAPAKDAKS